MIQGAADPSAAEEYFERTLAGLSTQEIERFTRLPPGLGLRVSRLGFGSYRVSSARKSHFDALREALLKGVNVIDVASNFSFGAAEELVAAVMSDLIALGRLKREEIVVLGKAGLIQGRSLKFVEANRPDDFRKISNLAYYSLHPDYLERQFHADRQRLRLEKLDGYLLQNPEILLSSGALPDESPQVRREILREKTTAALNRLEDLCSRGFINFYGICSETLHYPADHPESLPLEDILRETGPGFRVLQFPANLLETDYKFNRSSSGGPLAELARRERLWTMGLRPLNARDSDGGLLRLARLVNAPLDEGAGIIAELNRLLGALQDDEKRLLDFLGEERFQFSPRTPPLSKIFLSNRDEFVGDESLSKALAIIQPQVQKTVNRLFLLARTREEKYALEKYGHDCNQLIGVWKRYSVFLRHERLRGLEEALGRASPSLSGKPLAAQALLFLLAAQTPDTALVGMRRVSYARQLIEACRSEPPPENEQWPLNSLALDWAEKNLGKFH